MRNPLRSARSWRAVQSLRSFRRISWAIKRATLSSTRATNGKSMHCPMAREFRSSTLPYALGVLGVPGLTANTGLARKHRKSPGWGNAGCSRGIRCRRLGSRTDWTDQIQGRYHRWAGKRVPRDDMPPARREFRQEDHSCQPGSDEGCVRYALSQVLVGSSDC